MQRYVGSGNMFIDIDGGDAEPDGSEVAADRVHEYGLTAAEVQRQRDGNVRPILTRSPLGADGVSSDAVAGDKRDDDSAGMAQGVDG